MNERFFFLFREREREREPSFLLPPSCIRIFRCILAMAGARLRPELSRIGIGGSIYVCIQFPPLSPSAGRDEPGVRNSIHGCVVVNLD